MIATNKHIFHVILLCSVLLFTGCSDEGDYLEPPLGKNGSGDVTLSLKVRIGNTTNLGETRAEPFLPTDNPYELINTLRVIITRKDNTVEFNRMINMPPGVGLKEVGQLEFEVSTSLGKAERNDENILLRTEEKHIYLVANEASIPNDHVRNMLETLKEGYYEDTENIENPEDGNNDSSDITPNYVSGDTFLPSSAKSILIYNDWTEPDETIKDNFAIPMVNNEGATKGFIPMSEFFDVTVTSNLTNPFANKTQEKELFITRNLVKFEFEMDATPEMESFRVTDITFSSLMQKEYLFPDATYSPSKYYVDGTVNIEDKEIIKYKTPGFEGNSVRPYVFKPSNFGYNSKRTGAAPTTYNSAYKPALYFCESKTLEGDEEKLSIFSLSIGVEFDTDELALDEEGDPVLDTDGNPTYKALRMEFDAKNLSLPEMLPRNTIVRVKMSLKNGELSATVTVFPYTGVYLKPEFGVIIQPTGITLDKTTASIAEGETMWLSADITPEDSTETILKWSSSDESVVTVNEDGMVTGVKAGDATITVATSNGHTASCKITVKPEIKATGITIDQTTATIAQGNTLSLYAQVMPANVTNKKLTWSSSNEGVAKVDDQGVITAIAQGQATITAKTSNGLAVSCNLTVTPEILATGITLNTNRATIAITVNSSTGNITSNSNRLLLYATLTPANATNTTLTWSSSNEGVAFVDNGCVTAINPGTATITAKTSNGKTATCVVTVTGNQSSGVSLDKTKAIIGEGSILLLTASLTGNPANKTLTWSSSDEKVAIVENGFVTALKPGTATITVKTSNGKTASCVVTVTNVSLNKNNATLTVGESENLTATIAPNNISGVTLKWESSDPLVASVTGNGVITAHRLGNTTISVSSYSNTTLLATATCEITVTNKDN